MVYSYVSPDITNIVINEFSRNNLLTETCFTILKFYLDTILTNFVKGIVEKVYNEHLDKYSASCTCTSF